MLAGAAGVDELVAHVPHLYLQGPWAGPTIDLSRDQLHHLTAVLRLRSGEPCSYTDGAGMVGEGLFDGVTVARSKEHRVAEPIRVTLAVAPPSNRERLRFLVEKAAELGAHRVRWLTTRYGQGRPPRSDKAQQWAVGALEQSRGAYLTTIDDQMVSIDELTGTLVAADRGGATVPSCGGPLTLLVGPEGGWGPGELPTGIPLIGLGQRVLRTETAAIVGLFAVMR